ncbi:hypothetical protein KAM28_004515 [Salmonella enterica subsp. diarizonae serovar 47:k:z53:[z84]]|nr:hypothetical protein [Salmonella enterica subsp. diarizonae serovar 47:k:z53:[z84]]
MNDEYRAEFGCLFPVQVRFSPEHRQFQFVICSPGEVNECWPSPVGGVSGVMSNLSTPAVVLRCRRIQPGAETDQWSVINQVRGAYWYKDDKILLARYEEVFDTFIR